ncbi:MAG: hypothetical protein JRH01_10035 [Deltaproteobacteria bacterium]|nr:hypothetical protein [Deltaproteobacteria bacterium]
MESTRQGFSTEHIDDWLEDYRRHFHGRLYRGTTDAVIRWAVDRFAYN